MFVLSCDGCGVAVPGEVWVVRETRTAPAGSGGRRASDPRNRRAVNLCRACWNALDQPLRTVDLPCRICGRIRHCDASRYHGTRFLSLHACSPGCAGTARRRRRRGRVTLCCAWCGAVFTTVRRDARFCSTAHRQAAHRTISPSP